MERNNLTYKIKMKYLAQAIRFGSWMQCIHFPNIYPICEMDTFNIQDESFKNWEEVQTYTTASCQNQAPWHLERIQERVPNYYNVAPIQKFQSAYAYVVDTWIDIDHPQFEKRVIRGKAFAEGQNGHGTHVAGLITSSGFGVQKNATVISIQTLGGDGAGSTTNVLAGMSWAYYDWLARGKPKAVISMSISGGYSALLNQATESLYYAGLPVIVAAGNNNDDACHSSPSSASKAITVGATDRNDTFAGFSNYGSCVTLNAPGVDIISLYPNGLEAIMSGTSMATPIVTGIALSLSWTSPDQLKNQLIQISTKEFIKQIKGATPNLLAFVMPPEICLKPQSPSFLLQKKRRLHK